MVEAASGRMDDAFESLQEALMMAEPYGYCRIFLDERKVHSLIRAYAFRTKRRKAPVRNRVSVNYLNRLLSLLPESLGMEQADGAESPPRVLSARELEIARLVARGFTNKEIAETLFISYRTVTTHLDKIYNKLHVHSRTELLVKLNDSRWI
ncbi:MAG: LuxR C-terminal-related transcriptional regulator [Alicyclobacillus sp.]|nr:LuxR C-terminal-related transcriptional regulator [Alicyclobacillus sp.]